MKPLAMLLLAAVWGSGSASAAGDAAEGRKLVAEKQCETCHHNKTLGDAKAVYLRKDRKVTTLAKLKAQVAVCNSQLNLGLFPEDEEHIVAYLDQAYYKFAR
jgi:cytochrome c553